MQKEDLLEIKESLGLDELLLLCHVQSLWLSLLPTLLQLVQIKEAVKQLILVDLPRSDNDINKSDRFISIKKLLEIKEVDVEIQFLINVKPAFDDFMTSSQKEESMIHLLYSSTEKLLKTLMAGLLKSDTDTQKMAQYEKTFTWRMLICSFKPRS